MSGSEPTFFAKPSQFRNWLKKNHKTELELIVGFWKVDSGSPSMTWPESVDEALCFGWIDGVRRRIDERSYKIRFTPRRPNSVWSVVNIKKYHQLCEAGRMTKAGEIAFSFRQESKSGVYAFEQPEFAELSAEHQSTFYANQTAWEYFQNCPPSYRKTLLHWVTTAKKPETRTKRLMLLIQNCEAEKRMK